MRLFASFSLIFFSQLTSAQERICAKPGSLEEACHSLSLPSTYAYVDVDIPRCIVAIFANDSSPTRCSNLKRFVNTFNFYPNTWLDNRKIHAKPFTVRSGRVWTSVQNALIVPQNGYALVSTDSNSELFPNGIAVPASGMKDAQGSFLCELSHNDNNEQCLTGFLKGKPYRGKCYTMFEEKGSSSEYANKCEENMAYPVKITDDDMNQYVANLARDFLRKKGKTSTEDRVFVSGIYDGGKNLWRHTNTDAGVLPLQYYRWLSDTSNGFPGTTSDAASKPVATLHVSTNGADKVGRFGYWENAAESESHYYFCEMQTGIVA